MHEGGAVDGDDVMLASRGPTVTASSPPGGSERIRPGDRVAGSLSLLADGDVVPGQPLSGLEQLRGSAYVARGRVVDARAGRVQLELDDGFRLRVDTGAHRIRADIRDSTEVRGTLRFAASSRH